MTQLRKMMLEELQRRNYSQTTGVEIVTVSGRQNKNLAAQKSLFLLDRSGTFWQSQLVDASPGYANLLRYCLPVSESTNLLNLLSKLGVDRAHLMPSFDGVSKELEARRERQKRDRIPRVGESV